MPDIRSASDFETAKTNNDTVLFYLSTPECRVCKSLRPKVAAMAEEVGVPFTYVDTTGLQELTGQLLVFGVPTLILFVYGKEMDRFNRHLSMAELQDRLGRAKMIVDNS